MEVTDQKKGEARVKELLIDPLDRLGLARPKGTLVAQFDGMKRELCARLWRLDAGGLSDLCDWVLGSQAAKENHWPPAAIILVKAKTMLPPPWPPSERMVNMFNHEIGQAALAEGWAPELYWKYVGDTAFPNKFSAQLIQSSASGAMARFARIERDKLSDMAVSEDDVRWFDRRRDLIALCEKIRDYNLARGAA